ncbi:MAG: hypothetical protein M1818_003109 [Claussenomyces sp. TS43310]|nr:MAG: hypothetical protein M1818_003109 [Claussenomyces sp. TS43310]
MFVVGAGLSTLETAADPFLSICGPPRYSEIRLNLAQAVQGVGSMLGPLLASYVFFKHVDDTTQGLQQVQWTYLGVACFVALLAIIFFFIPLPEITSADMAAVEAEIGEEAIKPFWKQTNLFLGVSSQFAYTGAQIALANYFIAFCIDAGKTKVHGSQLLSASQGIYAAMRFIFGFLMMNPRVKPRLILISLLGGAFVFAIAAMNTSGDTSIALLMMVFAFESACFATIFTLSLRGLGRHTKLGGSLLVSAISGGMVFPPITGAVIDARNAHFAMIIPAMGYVIAWIFPIYVNFFNAETMDLHRATAVNADTDQTEKELELERA